MPMKSVSMNFEEKEFIKNQWDYNYATAVSIETGSININDNFPLILDEDKEFARRTEAALRKISEGQGIEMEGEEFLKELETW